MECNYGGGLFLEFQPLTDCMLCEGVGRPYCRLYYLWKMLLLLLLLLPVLKYRHNTATTTTAAATNFEV